MTFQSPAPRARRGSRKLTMEHLERRELLAADLMDAFAPTDSPETTIETAPIDASLEASRDGDHHARGDTSAALMAAVNDIVAQLAERGFDGTGNNLSNVNWGAVGEQLLRIADADYEDGLNSPSGADRPSAREISNALSAQIAEGGNDRGMSAFVFAWGQFIDHDIDLTHTQQDGETLLVEVPVGDPFFDPEGTGTEVIATSRSEFDPDTGIDSPREQTNSITAWIDGSMVYGSDQATADNLRSFSGGRLLTSDGDLPPLDASGFFMAGDVRANENTGLLAMQTLFIREHNFWAGAIAQSDPSLGDEEIFQQARAIVVAEIQAITFNEFLPALLGRDAIDRYAGYDQTVDPSIANEFSTAAFRMHTLINDEIGFIGNDGREVREAISLADSFFNPSLLQETGIDSVLKYFASAQSQEYDLQVVDSLRNFLFGQPGQGGLDLASLNIERGRDHGLADYNAVREAYGLERVESFADISSDTEIQHKLEQLYGDVDNIDLWVGVLAEDHVRGSSVGELAQTIVADQFERLRDGDRFWYQNVFSGAALRQIESTSLADVISRNTTIDNLQSDVFFMRAEISGEVFVDANGDGIENGRERGLAGITVELLDNSGEVINTTTTNRDGRYRFTSMTESGDYQVRLVLPDGSTATTETTADVLVSAGDDSIRRVDFGIAGDGSEDNGATAIDAASISSLRRMNCSIPCLTNSIGLPSPQVSNGQVTYSAADKDSFSALLFSFAIEKTSAITCSSGGSSTVTSCKV